jgi:hypothetical protein
MNPSPSCLRKLNYTLLAVFCWMSTQGLALAAEGSDSGGGSGGALVWIMPYAFAILCIGLGMFVVCRGARRKERAHPEQYEKVSLIDRGDPDKAVAQEKRHGVRRTKQESKEAKTALTISIVGLFIPGVCIVGLLQGMKARKLISQDRRLSGDEKALGAVIVGALGIPVWLLIGVFVLMSLMGPSSDSTPSEPAEPPAAEAEAEPAA